MGPLFEPGAVQLTVADLDRERDFYERAIGLRVLESARERVRLGAGGEVVVELIGAPETPLRPRGSTGLFHLAILVGDRGELARAARRVEEAGWALGGASDHLVSEALYLADPEGNGIEIYRDRPREEWRYANGELQMATLPLDLKGVLASLPADGGKSGPMAAGTRLGHVHLQVANLDEARRFYVDALGFEVTVESYTGALFVASGGYHHHIGLNTWAGEGAPAPPPRSRGLRRFELLLSGDGGLDGVARRLKDGGYEAERGSDGVETADPSRNAVLIKSAA